MLVGMDRQDQMRAGDADRAAVAERLRSALDEGRLDLHEYDERLQGAYAAKTYGELNRLLVDLPGTIPAERARLVPFGPDGTQPHQNLLPGADGGYPGATRRWLLDTWDGYVSTVAITVAIWAVICVMSGQLLYFWPGWVAGPWGAVLLVTTVTGLTRGEPRRWAAKQAGKEQERADQRALKRSERECDASDH